MTLFFRPSRGAVDRVYYGCLRGQKHSVRLGSRSDENSIQRFTVAGTIVAFESTSVSSGGLGIGVVMLDLRAPTHRYRDVMVAGRLETLLVARRGAAVWIEESGGTSRVRVVRFDGSEAATLYEGPVDADSLAISEDGRIVYWSVNGEPEGTSLV